MGIIWTGCRGVWVKMIKVDKLKNAVITGDKSRFIQSIFDFSKKDITEFTEQEFEEVLDCCSKIKLDGIQEFFDFLLEEGMQVFIIPEDEYNKEKLLVARFYLSIFLIISSKRNPNFAEVALITGKVCQTLAQLGIHSKKNLKQSIKLIKDSRILFLEKNIQNFDATNNLAISHQLLADLGVEFEENHTESIKLLEEASTFLEGFEYAQTIGNMGIAYLSLAQHGLDREINLKKSIKLLEKARKLCMKFKEERIYSACAAQNLGLSHLWLATFGIEPQKNLEKSIQLQKDARENLPKGDIDFGRSMMNQGQAQLYLAELDLDPKNNLEKSIKLEQEARKLLPEKGLDYAVAVGVEGHALIKLAELGIDTKNNLEEAIKLEEIAREINPKDSLDYGVATINQGNAYVILAEHGFKPKKNLKESIKLYQEAIEIYPKDSPDYAFAAVNKGNAHGYLAAHEVEIGDNYQIAEGLLKSGANVFLKVKDGWNYPLAILSIHRLNVSIFWRNGDKSFLINAINSLEETRKIIETWEVLRKNEILTTLYEAEADLCELEEDYYNAGMKYRDAYKLTKNEYYRFMYDFCGAKAKSSEKEEKPFCKLAIRWKQIDKKGVFLDFFDYVVFECHLEEALENEAIRFDEINKAKNKLYEIYARTSIYHIKVRVSAYIEILNAYLDYFPEKDEQREEEKAKENISSACRVFKNQGYRYEIELCNLFIKAIKNKDQQEVWLDLIKNHLSNNLSKLITEAAVSEMTKLQTRGKADFGVIKENISEMKNKIDDLTILLKPGTSEELVISVGAEFAGSGIKYEIHIPSQEIAYPDIKNDLEKIKGRNIFKLASLPAKLAAKIREYLIENKKDELLKYLS